MRSRPQAHCGMGHSGSGVPSGRNSTFLPEALGLDPRSGNNGAGLRVRGTRFSLSALMGDLESSGLKDEEVTSVEPKKLCPQPFLPQ